MINTTDQTWLGKDLLYLYPYKDAVAIFANLEDPPEYQFRCQNPPARNYLTSLQHCVYGV